MAITFNHNDQVYVKDGKMGIGASDPLRNLHVVGNFVVNAGTDEYYGVLIDGGESAIPRITIGDWHNSSATIKWDSANNYLVIDSQHSSSGSAILFTGNDSATEYMRITNTGNVGIGTTSPSGKLHSYISESRQMGHNAVGGDLGVISDNNSAPVFYVKGTGTADLVNVFDNTTEVFTIKDGGNVGIGTSNMYARLNVRATSHNNGISVNRQADTTAALYIGNDGGNNPVLASNNADMVFGRDVSGTFTERMRLTNGGNLGIGTTSPTRPLHVVGGDSGSGTHIAHFEGRFGVVGMYIRGNGNVGIGTTSPSYKLHTYGADNRAYIESNIGQASVDLKGPDKHYRLISQPSAGGARFDIYDQTASAHRFRILTDGGIQFPTYGAGVLVTDSSGVITASTDYQTQATADSRYVNVTGDTMTGKLTINRGSTNDPALNLTSSSSGWGSGLRLNNTGATGVEYGLYSSSTGYFNITKETGAYGTILRFTPSNNLELKGDNLFYTGSGNVGIGTTSPSQKLDVNGDIAVKGASIINKASAALVIGDIAGTDSVTNLTLSTAGRNTEVFLDDSGNVGVNTTTPSYNLTVDSGANDIGIVTASSDSGSYIGFIDNSTTVATMPKVGAVGNKLILDASQYVGIRRTDPSYALDVSGTIRATGDVIAYSDARVKENVETIPNALDKVKAMRGVGYNKIGEEKRSIGVIAQEMLEVMPEVVSQDEQGMYSVAYGNLVGVLIEAMKDQQKQIDELKAQLDGIAK